MGELIRILSVARSQYLRMAGGILLSITVMIANALLMAISGWFIASMAVAGVTGVAFNYLLPAAAIRAFAILRTVGRYGERLVTHEAGFRVLALLRVWFFRKLEPLAPAGLERYTAGDVAGRLRSDVDALESLYLRIVLPLATGVIAILLAALFVACWSLPAATALLICLLAAGLFLPLLARRLATEPGRRAVEIAGELRSVVTEGLQGGEELLLLGAVELQAARVEQLSEQLVAEQEKLARINGLTLAGGVVCAGLGLAGVLAGAGAAVGSGTLAGPLLAMLLLFAGASFEAAAGMPTALQLVPGCRASIRRIRELADAPLPVPEPTQPATLPTSYDIICKDVAFAYDPTLPVLRDFSFSLREGERLALAGPSGSGKSSVVELLLRFRPYSGSITIGGSEVRDLASDDLLRLIAAVPQRPHLFNSSIRDNLLLAHPQATDTELHQALADACLSDWVAGLPEGLETRVGEGGSAVSGGEGRRIALARALLKDAPIVILDEPTEGLDLDTEKKVIARLTTRLKGKTVLIISHRPACLTLADRVVWMTQTLPPLSAGIARTVGPH
jgi:ATP-binding cassette subfamily C protein CydC